MAYDPSKYTTGPSEQELRMRAAHRVARRRSFTTSLVVVGSLIVLNLFFYAQSHNATWLMLDAVFACTLAYRAWVAFGSDHKDDALIQQEMARMRSAAAPTPWPQQQSPTVPPPPPSSEASNWNL
jgi:hypothetical protein